MISFPSWSINPKSPVVSTNAHFSWYSPNLDVLSYLVCPNDKKAINKNVDRENNFFMILNFNLFILNNFI